METQLTQNYYKNKTKNVEFLYSRPGSTLPRLILFMGTVIDIVKVFFLNQAEQKKQQRRRENHSRRHTLQNGIDYGLVGSFPTDIIFQSSHQKFRCVALILIFLPLVFNNMSFKLHVKLYDIYILIYFAYPIITKSGRVYCVDKYV